MKKVLFILAIVLIHLPGISQEIKPWMQQYWELSKQIANTENEDEVTKLAQQQVFLLRPIYENYRKNAYNDGLYGKICISLVQAYSSLGQYKHAKDIIDASVKHIKDNVIKLRLNIEQIKITSLQGDYEKAELLSSQIEPTISRYITELQNNPEQTKVLDIINAIINYDSAITILKGYFVERINDLIQCEKYIESINLLQQKKLLFTSLLLSNETISIINECTNRILQNLSINSFISIGQDGREDPSVFYYSQLATCYTKIGQHSEAAKCYYLAEQNCAKDDLVSVFCIVHTYLMEARYLSSIGNGLRAEQYYSKCINMCAQSGSDDLINAMNYAAMERAALIVSMGATEEAHDTITILIEYYLNKKQLYTLDFLNLLSYAISVAQYEKDYKEALQLSNQALEIIPQITEITDLATYTGLFYNKKASCQIYLGQYNEAIASLKKIPKNYQTSNTFWIKGNAEYRLKLYNDAINSLYICGQLQPLNEPIENQLERYAKLLAISIEANNAIDTQEMASNFQSYVNTITSVSTNQDLARMISIMQIYYELFILYYRHFNVHADIAYDLTLKTKGAALKNMIDLKNRVYSTNNKNLIKQYESLGEIEKSILNEANPDKQEVLKAEVYEKERGLLFNLDAFSSPATSWMDVQESLQANSITIEFVNYMLPDGGNDEYLALILRKDWNAPKMIPLCKKTVLESLTKRLQQIYNSKTHKHDSEPYIYKSLYKLIWSKLEPYINEGDNVYFSPSGLLHQINIEILRDSTGCQANEKYNLYRVSSTRELCRKKPAIAHRSAVLYGGLTYEMDTTAMAAQSRGYHTSDTFTATRGFVADSTLRAGWSYLPATYSEVNSIARQMTEHRIKTTRYVETAGTEESFKALSGKHTPIIHIATHGFFFKDEEAQTKNYFQQFGFHEAPVKEDNSLKRSGLVLAGGQRAWLGETIPDHVEDGILLAEEIATLDLSGTDLLVLSACETGLGEITSEGVFGLQRAFKKAGVQTLIMSLWKVSDEATALMMRTFYENLLSGKSKRESFSIAQQTVKAKHDNPYYWASFIMLD